MTNIAPWANKPNDEYVKRCERQSKQDAEWAYYKHLVACFFIGLCVVFTIFMTMGKLFEIIDKM